ncbi:hypothetical protein HA402_001491 [Bradysia odoriphaga]|nr:hypothetical protein HA402_001491 [Bradysia odoriphaga]
MFFVFIFLICVSLWLFRGYVNKKYDYFKNRNTPFLRPCFLLGNTAGLNFSKYVPTEFEEMMYNKFPDKKLYGYFDYLKPVYQIRDPELLRQIAIKDFDHFADHIPFLEPGNNDLLGNSLFMLNGQKWRDMRATLSGSFTGSKMRLMFELVSECAVDTITYLLEKAEKVDRVDLEMKDLFSRYTIDVIASCAFGCKINSLKTRNNEFYNSGMRLLDSSSYRIFLFTAFPKLMKFLGINFIADDVSSYFTSIIRDTINERRARNISRPDVINALMQVMDGGTASYDVYGDKIRSKRVWTETELMAQSFLFFFAGFKNSSNILSILTYELAVNPTIQEKLHREVKSMNDKLNQATVDYDSLQKMKYIDQVVSEVLRKWPPSPVTDRLCLEDYRIVDGDEVIRIEKGAALNVPIYGIHRDPKYYPNPAQFDPDRFSEANKRNIVPGTYLPFGIGQRSCIASRFALMEIKAVVYHLLLKFKFEPNEHTPIPLKFKRHPHSLKLENGIHLSLSRRY